jgi:hypothetical protein
VRFNPGFVFFCQGVKTWPFSCVVPRTMFSQAMMFSGVDALRFTFCQAFGDRRGDALKHDRADGGGDQINAGNQVNNVVADAADALTPETVSTCSFSPTT